MEERQPHIEVAKRRLRITEILLETPMTTSELVEAMGISLSYIQADMSKMRKHGGVLEMCGKRLVDTPSGPRYAPVWKAKKLYKPNAKGRTLEAKIELPDVPKLVADWLGYTTHVPVGGEIIGEERFHQTPRSKSSVRVWPGTSWSQVETAL